MRDLKSSTTMALLSLLAIGFCETFAARGLAGKPHGDVAIQDGKIEGDTISFTEVLDMQGKELKIVYSGKINGDEIKFTRKVGDFATEDLVAKREK